MKSLLLFFLLLIPVNSLSAGAAVVNLANRIENYVPVEPLPTTVFESITNVFRKPNGQIYRRNGANDPIYNERAANDNYYGGHHANDFLYSPGSIVTDGLLAVAVEGVTASSAAGFTAAGAVSAAALSAMLGFGIGIYIGGGFESTEYSPIAFNIGSPFHEVINPSDIKSHKFPIFSGDYIPEFEYSLWYQKWQDSGYPDDAIDTTPYLDMASPELIPTGRPDFDSNGIPDEPTQPGLLPRRLNQYQSIRPEGLESDMTGYQYCARVIGGKVKCYNNEVSICLAATWNTCRGPQNPIISLSYGDGKCNMTVEASNRAGQKIAMSCNTFYLIQPNSYNCPIGTSVSSSDPQLCHPNYKYDKPYYGDHPVPIIERTPQGFVIHPSILERHVSPTIETPLGDFIIGIGDQMPLPTTQIIGMPFDTITTSLTDPHGVTHDITIQANPDGTVDVRRNIDGIQVELPDGSSFPVPMRWDTKLDANLIPQGERLTVNVPNDLPEFDPNNDRFIAPDGTPIFSPWAPPDWVQPYPYPPPYPMPDPVPNPNPQPNPVPNPNPQPLPGDDPEKMPLPGDQPETTPLPGDQPETNPNPKPNPNPNPNPNPKPNPNPNTNPNPDPNINPSPKPNPKPKPKPKPNPKPKPKDKECKPSLWINPLPGLKPSPKPEKPPPPPFIFEWRCGIAGTPPCVITGEPAHLPDTPTTIPNFSLDDYYSIPEFEALPNAMPSRAGTCPVAVFDLRGLFDYGLFNQVIVLDAHCDFAIQYANLIGLIFTLMWILVAVGIVLEA